MITFYATIDADKLPATVQDHIPAIPVLLPASSFYRRGFKPPRLPARVTERAADCGGFVASRVWGSYRYTPDQYVRWLETWQPAWAATMDYCCEDEITAGKPGIVRERQDMTTDLAWLFWRSYRAAPWAWAPTVQGWAVEDYTRHARNLAPLVAEMMAAYGPASPFRVGIGTLCRRASNQEIRAIVRAVAAELPGVRFHLWGIKLGALQSRIALPPAVASVDSAAWDAQYGARDRDRWKSTGMRRVAHNYLVDLPAYLDKVQNALNQPKQIEMF